MLAVMKVRMRNLILIVATVVVGVSGISVLGIRRAIAPPSNLNEIRALARDHQFERAQALLLRYLRVHPRDDRAHLLMAQLATEPPAVRPELALEHLRLIRPGSTKQAALIKFFEGKANYQRRRYDLAETSWTEALKLDPIVPEAGWALVDLLDKERRSRKAHRLGMKLHEVEPDPRDRVRILLEMSRLDIEVPDPLSQVPLFEPIVREHPENLPLSITVGVALTRVNRSDDGLKILAEAVRRHPDAPEAWDGWFTGLYNASDAEKLAAEFAKLPETLKPDPRFAKHEGMVAQNAKDWPRAVRAYRRAFEFEPFNQGVCYRYRFVLPRRERKPSTIGSISSTKSTSRLTGKCAGPILARTARAGARSPKPRTRRTRAGSITRSSRSRRWACGLTPSFINSWPTSARRWGGSMRPEPGIAWCCATLPTTHSAWQP